MAKKKKQRYRIRNWKQYNKALVQRGSLTLWIETRATDTWLAQDTAARRGRRRTYADAAILCALTLREVYHLPLRATQGFVCSVLRLLHLELPAAHYSTLSRRARALELSLAAPTGPIKHLVIDSSGLKVYGEGEWKVRTHGKGKHRTWRKLHIAMDAATHQLTTALVTDQRALDRHHLHELLERTAGQVERVCADGAYDFGQCYRAIKKHEAIALIPPREDAVVRGKSPFGQRDENLRGIQSRGRGQWKRESTYHRRSLVETAYFRLKTVFSDRLRSRRDDTQRAEVMIRCAALNRMTSLGTPESYAI